MGYRCPPRAAVAVTVLCPFCGATEETWKPLPGWAGFHVSTVAGRTRTPGGRILAQRPSNRPREAPPEGRYRLQNLCLGGRKVTVTVHSTVLLTHGDGTYPPGERPEGKEGSHKDDNPAHNCAPNLCYEDHPTNERRKPPGTHAAAGRLGYAASSNRTRHKMGHDLSQMSQPVTGPASGKRGTARAGARAWGADAQQPETSGTRPVTLRRLLRRVFKGRKGTSVT